MDIIVLMLLCFLIEFIIGIKKDDAYHQSNCSTNCKCNKYSNEEFESKLKNGFVEQNLKKDNDLGE